MNHTCNSVLSTVEGHEVCKVCLYIGHKSLVLGDHSTLFPFLLCCRQSERAEELDRASAVIAALVRFPAASFLEEIN